MLPDGLINIAAIILPWLELVLGVLFVLGRWQEGTFLLMNILLIIFWFTLFFNYLRGVDINCGCFSTQTSESSSMVWYMVRNFFLCGPESSGKHSPSW
ncbi:MauE/DoxX family redox-associated membrane protein [Oleidesulfovibrio alaskensis]|uniref:MauE/DoxX family redox-associated membrane protein n=1 Tax=Oleidesulfovibrio alaskensis TaxID=58180 RepID=UPI00005D6676